MHGLYATSDPGFSTPPQLTNISFTGSETHRNTIQVNGQSGVTSMGESAIVMLENTDIKSRSQNAPTVGLRALSGGHINARNISVTSEDVGAGYASIAAVLSRNSGAKINISGDSYIDASRTDNQVALLADGTGSEINVADRAIINGQVISGGNNTSVAMDLSYGSVFSGTTNIVKEDHGNTYSGGSIRLNLTDSIWNMSGSSNLTSLTLNSGGVLNLNLPAGKQVSAGNVLTIENDYVGAGGTINFNTVLAGDNSVTDKLVIRGDTKGMTSVRVNNAGGSGAQTLNGIELIHVDGKSDGEFIQDGRIVAGAYDYTLGRGQGNDSGNWYLNSGKTPTVPGPAPSPEPVPLPKPEPVPAQDNDVRPEGGSYTANIAAANTMFVTRLHERLGPVQYTDVMTGETKNTSMWMRHEGGHNRWRDGTGQLKTQGNRYVVQLGGDIAQWGWGETGRWHLGVMAGYGNDHNNTDSVRTGYRSKGSVNGYSTGLYATWFASDETHNGAYLDTWAQYSWFDNHVKGDNLPGESWKSKGLTASLETGYTWKAGEFTGSKGSLNEWYVQPQAQVVWMGVKADAYRESNGTRVDSTGDGNVHTRLGVKTWIKGHNKTDEGKSREFSPFVEVNWLHNTRDFGSRMNGVAVHQEGARNIGEVKTGVEGLIDDRLNLWGYVGEQVGDKGYSDLSAMLGVKYVF
ncbi:autotransporter outer membrane beta-barrel domain-containing protein [Escherichia coli]|nr:autotransporter outer membrane beta-barrel domain-containing protein [Escherichia coli]